MAAESRPSFSLRPNHPHPMPLYRVEEVVLRVEAAQEKVNWVATVDEEVAREVARSTGAAATLMGDCKGSCPGTA